MRPPVRFSDPTDPDYDAAARAELQAWLSAAAKGPSAIERAAGGVQARINRLIPERVHKAVTVTIEGVTRAIVTGAGFTTRPPLIGAPLGEREAEARRKINVYKRTAAAEGGVAGAGGLALALAEFPVLLSTKIKLLFELAALYGHDTGEVAERLYILKVFQLAYSRAEVRHQVLDSLLDWDTASAPPTLEALDWRQFQQEYRDYIDLAKLAQLIPGIGAPVGAVVNYRLVQRLGDAAMNAYRIRWFGAALDA